MRYSDETYIDRYKNTKYAAETILELVIKKWEIHSAVDIGCGVGAFLNVIEKMAGEGVEVLGIDGEFVNQDMLVISENNFQPYDLENRIHVDRKFDLAISLEVAEHLSKERAESFVEDLTKLSNVILFSAAIPYQGGKGHINEQYLSYWVNLFSKYNYCLVDCIRPEIWNDEKIDWHYRQNTVVFCKEDIAHPEKEKFPIDIIHPRFWENKNGRLQGLEKHFIVKFGGCLRKLISG